MSSTPPGPRRNSSAGDPFSEPDVYYGDEEAISRVRDRKRAFSVVSMKYTRVIWEGSQVQLTHVDIQCA